MKQCLVSSCIEFIKNPIRNHYVYHVIRAQYGSFSGGEFTNIGIAIYNYEHTDFVYKVILPNSIESDYLDKMSLLEPKELKEINEGLKFWFNNFENIEDKVKFLNNNLNGVYGILQTDYFRDYYTDKTIDVVLENLYKKIVLPKFELLAQKLKNKELIGIINNR